MKLSYEWIKDYININKTPEEVAHGLTMSGSEVDSIEDVGKDKVMEMEITSNRPDCLNMVGLAREISAVFDEELKELKVQEVKISGDNAAKIECEIKAKNLCPNYTARIITDVKVCDINKKIGAKLEAIGLRTVNNIVDITNFCMMESGQPMHAFDLDKIRGNKIIIREAQSGEKITMIDGGEKELCSGMLVIADAERVIAIAGVMGGKDTEVTSSTKNILLESAYFDPISVRRTARELTLSTDSSYRFERGVDKAMVRLSSDRAAQMIAVEAKGKIEKIYEAGELSVKETSIGFSTERTNNLLGIEISKKEVVRILSRLGMTVTDQGERDLSVKVPSFREDLENEIDLIEEVARIYGYDKIPGTVTKFAPQIKRKEHAREVVDKIRGILPAIGLNEIMTYSVISETATNRFSSMIKDIVVLRNPLSEEQKVLTSQLLDGMMKTIAWNLNRRNNDLALFELGKIYSKGGEGSPFSEELTLCIGLTGKLRKNWKEKDRMTDIYDLKGVIEAFLEGVKVKNIFQPAAIGEMFDAAEIILRGEKEVSGFFGEVRENLREEYGIEQRVYIAQIKLKNIIETADLKKKYKMIAKFPFSVRDISILCGRKMENTKIYEMIKDSVSEFIQGIELKDVYLGKQIPQDKKSLSYSIQYGAETRTLTDNEIEIVHDKMKTVLERKLNVTFR